MFFYVVLIFALSIDTFMAALAYEGSKIKIPISSNLIISFICSFSLIISLVLGNYFDSFINTSILRWISFFILLIIGIIKIFDGFIKRVVRVKKLNFSLGGLSIVIEVYGDYKKADLDKSMVLSKMEAIYLGLALSIDSLASGLAFQTDYLFFIPIFMISFIINFLAISITKVINLRFDFAFFGGVIFIILAFLRI